MLATMIARWALFYADHKLVSLAITYLHLAGVLVGGGAAITLDRAVLRAGREARTRVLDMLAASHRTVVPALSVVCATGLLMALADRETFFASRLFYVKVSLVALLLVNGSLLLASERRASASDAGWRQLTIVSGVSLALWLVILLVGTWLPVAA